MIFYIICKVYNVLYKNRTYFLMDEETAQEEINDKTHAIESEEQTGDESFEAGIKEQ